MQRSQVVLLLAALLGACGDDDATIPPDEDIDLSSTFTDPRDFDRLGCTPGSLAGVEPAGIWHHDLASPQLGHLTGVIRYEGAGASLSAWVNLGVKAGRTTTDVRVSADDLFVRLFYENEKGVDRVRTFDFCARGPDGRLSGKWALCNGEWKGACYVGTVDGVRVERRPGEADAAGLALRGEFRGDPAGAGAWTDLAANVRVADGVAYVATYGDGLRIVDVADPAAMHELAHVPVTQPDQGEYYNDVKLVDAAGKRWALFASSRRGVVVYDVSDPATPSERATFPAPPAKLDHVDVHTLAVETIGGQTRAYLADTTRLGLEIWDVSDPAQPVRLGGFVAPGAADTGGVFLHDLAVLDGRVYLAYWEAGLLVLDAKADPAAPTLVGTFNGYERRTTHSVWPTIAGGRQVALVGDEDFGAHLRVVDVDAASPTFLQAIGELSLRPEVSIHNVMAVGDVGVVSWYQDGLRVLDLAEPTQPQVSRYANTWNGPGDGFYEGAIGVDVDATRVPLRIYVADTQRGLMVYDLAD